MRKGTENKREGNGNGGKKDREEVERRDAMTRGEMRDKEEKVKMAWSEGAEIK